MSGGGVTTGGVVSRTVTVCVAVVVRPPESVAVQVTTVVPSGNDPGASCVMVGFGSASVTVGVPMSSVVSGPVASAVTSAGG